MPKLVLPGVDRMAFQDRDGTAYNVEFPVETEDPALIEVLLAKKAVIVPEPKTPEVVAKITPEPEPPKEPKDRPIKKGGEE